MTTVLLACAAAASLLHRCDLFAPKNTYEAIQLAIGKALFFSALGFITLHAARATNAHRHNAIVSKHRANALSTYRVMVEAGSEAANRDIILTKAADCIFGHQPSGFGKADASESTPLAFVPIPPVQVRPSVTPSP